MPDNASFKSVLIEGWFDINHSYAIVARRLLRGWMKSSADRRIFCRRAPYYRSEWTPSIQDSDPVVSFANRHAWDGEDIQAVYRISYPYDTREPATPGATVYLFLTAEFQVLGDEQFITGGLERFRQACKDGWLIPVVPSQWCAEALRKVGIDAFHIVPIGIDSSAYQPRPVADDIRPGQEGAFVFVAVGAMTDNKGIDALLTAFYHVHRRHPHTSLLLKGLGSLYASSHRLGDKIGQLVKRLDLSATEASELVDAIVYTGDDLTDADMPALYSLADCFVAPYVAEGYCIPALEALACGLPVIASSGGPTDELVPVELGASIRVATSVSTAANGAVGLHVDVSDLVASMTRALTDIKLHRNALIRGTEHVRAQYDFREVSERMWALLQS